MTGIAASAADLFGRFPDAEAARAYMEERRWHGRPACPLCGSSEHIVARSGTRRGYYRCRDCAGEFNVRTGTIFERSHVPLHQWVYSMSLLATEGSEVSPLRLSNEIGVTQKTSGIMLRRLRKLCGGDADISRVPRELETIVDLALVHKPGGKPLRIIAGAPDKPLVIGEIEIPCYVLEDETRVLSQGGFLQAIGRSRTATARRAGADHLPSFLAAENLMPFISSDLLASTSPIRFQGPSRGPIAYGYPALLLPQVCEVYLAARDANALLFSQQRIAQRADVLIRALAAVGIVALVDEATGYQRIRAERALATILERYIAKHLQKWTRTFPYEFYEEIFRLKGWPKPEGMKRPSVIGHYTNDFVYARIAPGVLDELQRVNPVLPQGWRRNRHHQWFAPDFGHPKLKEHLSAVTALMRASQSWVTFKLNLDRAFPKLNTTIPMALDDD